MVTEPPGHLVFGWGEQERSGAAGNSYYGQLDLTSAGYVLLSSYYYLWANSYLSFEGGSLSLAQDTGVLSGTIITNTGSFKLDSGKMDP